MTHRLLTSEIQSTVIGSLDRAKQTQSKNVTVSCLCVCWFDCLNTRCCAFTVRRCAFTCRLQGEACIVCCVYMYCSCLYISGSWLLILVFPFDLIQFSPLLIQVRCTGQLLLNNKLAPDYLKVGLYSVLCAHVCLYVQPVASVLNCIIWFARCLCVP